MLSHWAPVVPFEWVCGGGVSNRDLDFDKCHGCHEGLQMFLGERMSVGVQIHDAPKSCVIWRLKVHERES